MTTNVRDWATGHWTIDGTYVAGAAGSPQASWNTPTDFTGSAESVGAIKVKVKWVGTGTPPTYMYLALGSTATAAELSESVPATVSGSNGQGDPFVVMFGGTGISTGIHAKRLKLDSGGEANYTVNISAKATKTAKIANLGASAGISYNLEPKALGLFRETSKRSPDSNASGPVTSVRASTGDVENEEAQIGATESNGAGLFASVFTVDRIGSWTSSSGSFSSTIAPRLEK